MFGIKTKKDKKIEELQAQLDIMNFKRPQIITTQRNVVTFAATQIIADGMPSEYVKRMIATKLVDEAIEYIHYDLEQHGTTTALKGYIQVVTY